LRGLLDLHYFHRCQESLDHVNRFRSWRLDDSYYAEVDGQLEQISRERV
jgi:hypothetical protein